jgi:hypothetical protein
MPNTKIIHHIKQLGVYLANNVPYTDIEIRKELLQGLVAIAEELDISPVEFCKLIETEYVVKEPVRN